MPITTNLILFWKYMHINPREDAKHPINGACSDSVKLVFTVSTMKQIMLPSLMWVKG